MDCSILLESALYAWFVDLGQPLVVEGVDSQYDDIAASYWGSQQPIFNTTGFDTEEMG